MVTEQQRAIREQRMMRINQIPGPSAEEVTENRTSALACFQEAATAF
jgi:hypothetical protein